jgi:hypothetical protein
MPRLMIRPISTASLAGAVYRFLQSAVAPEGPGPWRPSRPTCGSVFRTPQGSGLATIARADWRALSSAIRNRANAPHGRALVAQSPRWALTSIVGSVCSNNSVFSCENGNKPRRPKIYRQRVDLGREDAVRKPHLILIGAVAIGGLAAGTGERHADGHSMKRASSELRSGSGSGGSLDQTTAPGLTIAL